MNLFGARKNKEEIIAILDIGSASVGGVIIKAHPEDSPEILTSARISVNFLLDVNFYAFWRCTRNSFKKAIKQLLQDFSGRPNKVLCVFSSPWFISQTRIIRVKKEEPFKITKTFFDEIISNEIKIFKGQWQSEAPRLRGEPEVLEYNIMKVNVNGYQTEKPFGKEAQMLEVYIYVSLGIKEIKEEMEKIILENFGDAPVSFRTLPPIVFDVLRRIIKPETGYLFADVGGEVSDISLVRKDVLEETVSFSKGRNELLRKIASELKTFIKEAPSLLERFRKGHAGVSDAKKISSAVEQSKGEWCDSLGKALSEISGNGPLSQNFFLIGGKTGRPEFIECARNNFFSQFTILGKPFDVQQVLAGSLKHHFKFKRSFEKDGDIFLMMESLFANKNYG